MPVSYRSDAFLLSRTAQRSYQRLKAREEQVRKALRAALRTALLALFDKRSEKGPCGHRVSYTELPLRDHPVNIFAPESVAEHPGQILRVHRITGYYTEPTNLHTFMCVCHDHRLCVPCPAEEDARRYVHVALGALSHHDLHSLLSITLHLLRA